VNKKLKIQFSDKSKKSKWLFVVKTDEKIENFGVVLKKQSINLF